MTHPEYAFAWRGFFVRRGLALVAGLVVVLVSGMIEPREINAQILSPSEEAPQVSSLESTYLMGPEDVLDISVWKDEILSREVVVRPDGFITFPLIGEVRAEGRTVGDLTKEMDERLTHFISDPRIAIAVSEVNSFKIFVIGKVDKAGGFKIGQYTDVMQALSLAGGLTPFAREGSIKVLRRGKNGDQSTFPFDYGEVLKGRNLEQNIVLQRGDVVMVP
jgi:polysaccharide biosynthesis/export protein